MGKIASFRGETKIKVHDKPRKGFPGGSVVNLLAMHMMQETWVPIPDPEDPLGSGNGNPTLPGEPLGQRSLEGSSPWGHT